MSQHSNGVVVRKSGEGPATWAMGSLFEHLVSAEATEGRLDVSLVTQPPGIATPLHMHTHEAEAFYVLDGRVSYRAGASCSSWAPASSSGSPGKCRTPSASVATLPRVSWLSPLRAA